METWRFLERWRVPRRERLETWSTFDSFRVPSVALPSWSAADPLAHRAVLLETADSRALTREVAQWNERLAAFGGDPSRGDWSRFRPLRTEREEDWSDWLQHLVATATTATLLRHLVGEAIEGVPLSVEREVIAGRRRADLVVRWTNDLRVHVEVKVGDRNFSKTDDTAHALEQGAGTWKHVLLVPPEDVNAARDQLSPTSRVVVRTWHDVAIGLRVALLDGRENMSWLVWARTLCGSIEQKLLGLPCTAEDYKGSSAAALLRSMALAKKKGLVDERRVEQIHD